MGKRQEKGGKRVRKKLKKVGNGWGKGGKRGEDKETKSGRRVGEKRLKKRRKKYKNPLGRQ